MSSSPTLPAVLLIAFTTPLWSAPPAAPSDLSGFSAARGSLDLTWVDNSNDETGFILEQKIGDGEFTNPFGQLRPDLEGGALSQRIPGTSYTYRIASINSDGSSPFSNEFTHVARALELQSQSEFSVTTGATFMATPILVDTASSETLAFRLDELPPGLSFDADTGTISGIIDAGQYTGFTLTPESDQYRERFAITLDLEAPPVASLPETFDVLQGAVNEFDLDAIFNDPDVGSVVRYETSEGVIDIGLFDDTAPRTVTNYFAYADIGAWDGTFFHRSVRNFVIQGGGFFPADPGTATRIPTFPPLVNEFSLLRPNGRGTISMAKLGGDPDSATNQWFLSLENNTTNLDNQNGGFTVFGKILGDGLTIANAISTLPTGSFVVTDPDPLVADQTLTGVPLRGGATSSSEPGSLVTISSISRVPPLTYSTTTPELTITGSTATITASGETFFSVTATDLDGLSTTVEVALNEVSTPTDLRTFAAEFQIPIDPEDNSDGDALPALLEFATGSNPTVPESDVIQFDVTGTSPTLTFPFEGGITLLTAIVETSTDTSIWTPAWSSEQGLDIGGNLLTATPGAGTTTSLTVSSGVPFADAPRQFLRLRIIQN